MCVGRPDAAAIGKLLVCAAGSDEDIGRLQPIFDAVGRKTIRVGSTPDQAAITKLVGNFLIASVIEG
jgi:3-hydroxyisobutyrate dehydrogenase-like beta-hydroxyacid dehydrogenase